MSLRQLLLNLVEVPAFRSHAIEDMHFPSGGGRISKLCLVSVFVSYLLSVGFMLMIPQHA